MVHDQQVIDTLTVPTNKIKTWKANPPSSATRTTKHTPAIGRISDGQHLVLKIKQKLREIQVEREHLTQRLQTTNDDLSDAARLIETCLTLLAEPQELYQRCDDE